MLGKPFVRLLGTGTNDRNPCDLDKRGFLDIYRRTFAVRELLPLEMRRNWQPNLGFWAFFNRLPRRDQNVRWSGTLAWQPEGFCEAQYQAVLDLSTNARR